MITYQKNLRKFRIVSEKSENYIKRAKIMSPTDAANYIYDFYENDIEIYESFFILLLNNGNGTIGYAKISQGGVAGTVVDPVIVAKYAIDNLAKSVVLAHNHPSGNLEPSEADKKVTRKIAEGLKLFDITVVDHLILGPEKGDYYSFANEGNL